MQLISCILVGSFLRRVLHSILLEVNMIVNRPEPHATRVSSGMHDTRHNFTSRDHIP